MSKDITIVLVDSINHDLAKFAIEKTLSIVDCKEVITFSNKPILDGAKFIPIRSNFNFVDYGELILKNLWSVVDTEYCLIVQWDGMAANADAWTDDFLKYDYIGAVWPWYIEGQTMGNGGFSLRSRRLFEACRDHNIYLGKDKDINEDIAICVKFRNLLENKHNIKFAPNNVARQFSVENEWLGNNTFGFHGFWNVPRFFSKNEIHSILNMLPSSYWKFTSKAVPLVNSLFENNYQDLAEICIEKMRKESNE